MTPSDWFNIYAAIFVPAAGCVSLFLCSVFIRLAKMGWERK